MKLVRDTSTTFLTLSFSKNYRSTIYLNEEPFSDDINSVSCVQNKQNLYFVATLAVLSIICSLLKSSVLTTPTSALAPLHIRQVTVQVAMGSKVDPLRRPI